MPREWLGSETSVEEVETDFQGFDQRWHTEWREFISKMQPGDQLRHFCSSDEAWRLMTGRAGYAIVRQGEVVDAFITILS